MRGPFLISPTYAGWRRAFQRHFSASHFFVRNFSISQDPLSATSFPSLPFVEVAVWSFRPLRLSKSRLWNLDGGLALRLRYLCFLLLIPPAVFVLIGFY